MQIGFVSKSSRGSGRSESSVTIKLDELIIRMVSLAVLHIECKKKQESNTVFQEANIFNLSGL